MTKNYPRKSRSNYHLLLIDIAASLEHPKITKNKNLKAIFFYILYLNNPST